MGYIVVNSQRFLPADIQPDNQALSAALALAKAAHRSASCMCTAPARRLVVRKLSGGDRHCLAVWPDDGPNHDPSCRFHREESLHAPIGVVSAITPTEDGIHLNVSIPLEERIDGCDQSSSLPIKTASPNPGQGAAGGDAATRRYGRLDIGALLRFIWSSSGMNKWHPGWQRPWGRFKYEVDELAQQTTVGQWRLAELMYVAPVYREAAKSTIAARWSAFCERLRPQRNVRPRGLVLAELKAVHAAKFGLAMHFKHMAHPIYVSNFQWNALCLDNPAAIAWALDDSSQVKCVALLLVELTSTDSLRLVDAALIGCNQNYVPAASSPHLSLVQTLTAEGRKFAIPMPYAGSEAAADAVLYDTQPSTSVVIASGESGSVQQTVDALREHGRRVWLWAPGPGVGRLPRVEISSPRLLGVV